MQVLVRRHVSEWHHDVRRDDEGSERLLTRRRTQHLSGDDPTELPIGVDDGEGVLPCWSVDDRANDAVEGSVRAEDQVVRGATNVADAQALQDVEGLLPACAGDSKRVDGCLEYRLTPRRRIKARPDESIEEGKTS